MANIRREPHLKYNKERNVSPFAGTAPSGQTEKPGNANKYKNVKFAPPAEGAVQPDNKTDRRRAADEVFMNLAGVKSKADFLIDAINNNNRREFIPVYEDSDEVREAVSRKDPQNSPTGDKIYWDLFKRAIRDASHQFEGITLDVLDNLTGEPFADSRIINNNMKLWNDPVISQIDVNVDTSSGRNISDIQSRIRREVENNGPSLLERLLVQGGTLAFAFFLHKIMHTEDAPDKAAVSAPKLPSGTEIGPMILQIAIGFAIQMLLNNLSEQDTRRIMNDAYVLPKEAGVGMDYVVSQAASIVNRAKSSGRPQDVLANEKAMHASAPFIEMALDRMGEGDYEIIRDYAIQWLSTHNEEGYDEWLAYIDLYDISSDIERSLDLAPQYSPVFREHARKAGKTRIGVPAIKKAKSHYASRNVVSPPSLQVGTSSRYSYADIVHGDNWDDYAQDMLGTIQKDLLDSLSFQACTYNRATNRLAAFMVANPFVADLVCCFVRFMGSVDPAILRSIRSLIALFANGISFDLGGFLSKLHKRTWGDMQQNAAYELLGLIDEVFYRMINRILDWVDNIDERLLVCLPIDAMLNMSMAGIEKLKNQFKDLLLTLLDKIKTKGYTFDKKISILTERKWARKLLKIIDAVIYALQSGKMCQAEDRVYSASVNQFVNEIIEEEDSPKNLHQYIRDGLGISDNTSTTIGSGNLDESHQANNPNENNIGSSAHTSRESIRNSSRLDSINVYGVPIDIDSSIVGKNQFNTFNDEQPLITENGIDLPSFMDIIIDKNIWNSSLSAEQKQSCIDKMTDAEIKKFKQVMEKLRSGR